jgi:DNA-binding LacI/PurR family transcriptional regulator
LNRAGTNLIDSNNNVIEDISSHGIIIGYIIFAESIKGIDSLLKYLAKFHKPTAVLDELGDIAWAGLFPRHEQCAVFSLGYTKKCGMHVARHLLQLGHRHIAYVSPYHRNPYSLQRYTGLEEEFTSAGFPGKVEQCTFSDHVSSWEVAAGTADFRTRSGPTVLRLDTMKRAVNRFLQDRRLKFRNYHSNIFRRLLDKLEWHKWQEIDSLYMIPLFEKALSLPGVTAWVAVDDQAALMAIEFLKQNGKKVPAEISVVGFDDSLDAIENNVTSYNFNMQAIARGMLNFIFNPDIKGDTAAPQCFEVDGVVVARSTSGPAPAAEKE